MITPGGNSIQTAIHGAACAATIVDHQVPVADREPVSPRESRRASDTSPVVGTVIRRYGALNSCETVRAEAVGEPVGDLAVADRSAFMLAAGARRPVLVIRDGDGSYLPVVPDTSMPVDRLALMDVSIPGGQLMSVVTDRGIMPIGM